MTMCTRPWLKLPPVAFTDVAFSFSQSTTVALRFSASVSTSGMI